MLRRVTTERCAVSLLLALTLASCETQMRREQAAAEAMDARRTALQKTRPHQLIANGLQEFREELAELFPDYNGIEVIHWQFIGRRVRNVLGNSSSLFAIHTRDWSSRSRAPKMDGSPPCRFRKSSGDGHNT